MHSAMFDALEIPDDKPDTNIPVQDKLPTGMLEMPVTLPSIKNMEGSFHEHDSTDQPRLRVSIRSFCCSK